MKKSVCMFCGAPATLLCDGIIGYDAEEDEHGHMRSPKKLHTCDAPLCRTCATWHGNLFFHGSAGGGMDTHDLCPLCEALYQEGRKIRDHRIEKCVREPCMTDEQAAIIRQAHWNSHLNKHRREMFVTQGGGQQCLDL